MSGRYKRSAFCLLRWDGPDLLVQNCNTNRTFRGADRYLTVLRELGDWTTPAQLADRLGTGDEQAARRALERLVEMGLVVDEPSEAGADGTGGWDLIELAFQRQGAIGGYDPSVARAGEPPTAFKDAPPTASGHKEIALPRPSVGDNLSLGQVLEARRTRRAYASRDLTLDELGGFLWAAARVTSVFHDPSGRELSRRPYPSGGARHPLEIYSVCNAVEALEPGAYHYDPRHHRLHLVKAADDGQAELNARARASTLDTLSGDPPVLFVITAVFGRTMWKYDRMGLSLILKDVGCLYQTMYLVATAMGLAPCAVGGGAEADTARWLGLDPLVESQVGAFLLGPSAV